jgi:hypothetical protein
MGGWPPACLRDATASVETVSPPLSTSPILLLPAIQFLSAKTLWAVSCQLPPDGTLTANRSSAFASNLLTLRGPSGSLPRRNNAAGVRSCSGRLPRRARLGVCRLAAAFFAQRAGCRTIALSPAGGVCSCFCSSRLRRRAPSPAPHPIAVFSTSARPT